MQVPSVRLPLALAIALIALPSIALGQGEPIIEPLPGEPIVEPLEENGTRIPEPESEGIEEIIDEPADEIHPTEDEQPIAGTAEPAVDPGEPAANPGAAGGMTEKEYAAALRDVVRAMRGKVEESILVKVQDKQAERMDKIAWVLSLLALGGLLMFLAPFILKRRYPHRGGVLWKYSAISAGMFFLAVNLFAAVLMTMRAAQDAAGEYTNPQVQVVKATFDLFEKKAEDFAMVGPELVEPTLVSLTEETDKPIISIMLDNVGQLKQDVGVFASVGKFFNKLDWAFGLLPIILVLLAVLLFAQAARPTLEEIIRLPAKAAAADDTRGFGKAILGATFRNVWQELKATGGLLVVLLLLSAVAGLCLSVVLQPAIEIFMSYLALSFLYVQLTESASSFWILYALVSTIIFLVLNLAVMVAATALYLGKTQKILQHRFRNGVPLRTHRRFWLWGTGSLALLFGLPVVYILVADPALAWVVTKYFSETNWALNLGLGPSLFLVTFGLIFWAARGFKAFKMIATYKPQNAGDSRAPVELGHAELPMNAPGSWQTAQAAFQQPPPAPSPADLNRSDLPTSWEPAQTGMGPDAYPRLPSSPPVDPTFGAPTIVDHRSTLWSPAPPAPQPQPQPSLRATLPLPEPTPPRAPTVPPPVPRAGTVPPPIPRAATVPPPIPREASKPALPLPLPPAEPTPPRKRVARGTSSPPITPSQLNSAPPPLPLSMTDLDIRVSPYGDGRKR